MADMIEVLLDANSNDWTLVLHTHLDKTSKVPLWPAGASGDKTATVDENHDGEFFLGLMLTPHTLAGSTNV
jgi:hypothetical protein